ncbi:hypothetical protein [uncultured Eubacterium sp.]|uniref:hypothetical protein n=1 Tax=uncultured Eubacterium sp. TaxID=165185 RepID=UPI0025949F63|nr:hypothetical protein [uncultured Eubacterium sp.]
MAFRLGDVIIDRLQFGYAATKAGVPLYVLSQLSEMSIEVTADSNDIKDKDGNLVYRKYNGKTAEVNGTNTFVNLAIIEALSATSAEIATTEKKIKMPVITTVKAGETLDITGYVADTIVVNGLYNGAMGAEYKLGSEASATEFAVKENKLIPPTADGEIEYIVKYTKESTSGAKIVNSADKYPKAHELFFKALAVTGCNKEDFKPVIIRIPSFIPSPELTIALQGGDSQTMDYKGAILADTCSTDKTLFEVYFVDDETEQVKQA